MLQKASAYLKHYDGQTKLMYFLMTYWKNIILFLDKVSADIKRACNKNFSKTKIKSHGDEGTHFYHKEISKVDSTHTCLAVISLDSALKKDENYYPQVFLKECKYIEKKVIRHINDNLSDFSSDDESDEE